ncbi:MAG TPA: vitamin K epoxide reductase family protein [Anaerolineales bacterium]|nr:vitamin K epoxide reductase family protein [Anaerolineales bacterium]
MEKRLSQIAIALTTLGLLVSVYMTIYKITSNDSMCIGSQDCSVVNASRYSEIYGIPVAVLGVVGYTAILGVLLLERNHGFFKQNGSMLFFGLSLTGFLFTLYLIFLEVALIKAYCPFCIASQAAMTLIFILSVVRLVRQPYFQED